MKSPVLLTLLLSACLAQAADKFTVAESEATLDIKNREEVVLRYHKALVPPPKGVDPAYTRSGFIHPLRTPGGTAVTGIHPKDHYHHLGLWHVWVKSKHNGRAIDFWNLKKKEGTVRYAKTLETLEEDGGAGFAVEQEHVAFPGQKNEEVILREEFRVFVRLVGDAYEVDYETKQKNVTKHALELPTYRYGGQIALRGNPTWNNNNSDYLSSEGKTRADGHKSRSRWCAVWGDGKTKGSFVHFAFLGHRENQDAPQRMRVWEKGNCNGAIFLNYVPTQETGWSIKPGETSHMRYRIVLKEGKPSKEDLDKRWDAFHE